MEIIEELNQINEMTLEILEEIKCETNRDIAFRKAIQALGVILEWFSHQRSRNLARLVSLEKTLQEDSTCESRQIGTQQDDLKKSQIASRIFEIMDRLKLKSISLAEYLGVSRQYISLLRRGKTNISLYQAIKVARYLGVSLDYLLVGKDPIESGSLDLLNTVNADLLEYATSTKFTNAFTGQLEPLGIKDLVAIAKIGSAFSVKLDLNGWVKITQLYFYISRDPRYFRTEDERG